MKDINDYCERENRTVYLEKREPQDGHEKPTRAAAVGEMLAGDMAKLFSLPAEATFEWMDSQAALIEACHLVWCSGQLHNHRGEKLGFAAIVRMACQRLQVSVPSNPSAIIYKARQRKGVRVGSLLSRYLLLQQQGFSDPFRLCVRRGRSHRCR